MATERAPAPLFVVNVPRSGSTLMGLLLSGHPEVCIAPETGVVERLLARLPSGRRLEGRELRRLRRLVERDPKLHEWKLDVAPYLEELRGRDSLGVREAVDALLAHHRDHVAPRARILGLKKGSLVRHWPALLRLWPQARFLFTYRDARASVWSALENLPGRSVAGECRKWLDRVRAAEALERAHPGSLLAIRYERLVVAPQEELARVCAFLGLAYDERMLSFHERNRALEGIPRSLEPVHGNTSRPVSSGFAARWRSEASARLVRAVERRLGSELRERGYALVHVRRPKRAGESLWRALPGACGGRVLALGQGAARRRRWTLRGDRVA